MGRTMTETETKPIPKRQVGVGDGGDTTAAGELSGSAAEPSPQTNAGNHGRASAAIRTKTAHRDGTCQYCLLDIQAEQDELFPVQQSLCRLARAEQTLTCQPTIPTPAPGPKNPNHSQQQSDNRMLWVHAKCAITIFQKFDMPINPPVCRHWFRSTISSQMKNPKCPFDDECYFLHPDPATIIIPAPTTFDNGGGEETSSSDQTSEQHQSVAVVPVLSHRRTWGGRRRKLFKPTAAIFRHWLLETFGHDYLLGTRRPRDENNGEGNIGSVNTGTAREGEIEGHRQHHHQQQEQRRYVLDIAGGNGRLAFELENLSGIPTCVIDPRPLTLKKAYSKWKSGFYDKASKSSKLNRFLTHYDRSLIPTYPTHLRIFFDHDTLTKRVLQYQEKTQQQQQQQPQEENPVENDNNAIDEDDDDDDDSWWKDRLDVARRKTWTPKGLEEEKSKKGRYRNAPDTSSTTTTATTAKTDTQTPSVSTSQVVDRDAKDCDNRTEDDWLDYLPIDVQDGYTALSILSDCSMVIGMHPDQATEAAVDFALALNKPFAVVPCCVFSSHFPNRRLRDGDDNGEHTVISNGAKVKTTSQLVQYLSEKDDRIRVETLPFEGMNQVVFMTPDQVG